DILLGNYGSAGYEAKIYTYVVTTDTFALLWESTAPTTRNYSVAAADFANDRILGFATGSGGTTAPPNRVYRSDGSVPLHNPPNPPSSFWSAYSAPQSSGLPGILQLSWSGATDDKTPSNGLMYNVWVGTEANVGNIVSSATFCSPHWSNPLARSATLYLKILPDTTVYWNVQAIDTGFLRSDWPLTPQTTATHVSPAAVNDLTATVGINEGEIQLQWTAVGDDGTINNIINGKYHIKFASFPANWETANYEYRNGPWSTGTVSEPVTPNRTETVIVTGLTGAVTYYFYLKTADEVPNWSEVSNTTSTYAKAIPPGSITNLSCLPGSLNVKLTWTAPGDDDYSGNITSGIYEIRWTTAGPITTEADWDNVPSEKSAPYYYIPPRVLISTSTTVGATETYTVTGLLNGVTYYFAIKTADENMLFSGINTNSGENIAVPRSISTVLISQVVVGGDDIAAREFIELYNPWPTEVDISNFMLKYHAASRYPFEVTPSALGTIPSGTILKPYHYYLWVGSYSWTSVAPDIIGGASKGQLSGTGGLVFVVDTSSRVIDMLGYGTASYPEGGISTSAPTGTQSIERIPASPRATPAVDTDNNRLDFYLRAQYNPHNSQASPEPDNIPPAAVSNLTATAGSEDGSIILSWSAPGDDDTRNTLGFSLGKSTTALFHIKYSTSQITNFDSPPYPVYELQITTSDVEPQTLQSITLTGLYPGVTYYFAIRTFDESSNPSSWDASANPNNYIAAQDLPPQPPSGLSITSVSSTTVDLSWVTASSPTYINDLDYYRIYRATFSFDPAMPPPAGAIISATTPYTQTNCTITALRPEVTYYFGIYTVDKGFYPPPDGLFSIPVESTFTFVIPSTRTLDVPPAPITDLTSVTFAGEAKLIWTAVGDDGLLNEISNGSYKIVYTSDSAKDWTASEFSILWTTNTSPGVIESKIVMGLTGGLTYYFWITTADEVPNWAEISNKTTYWAPPGKPPEPFALVSPLDGVTISTITPKFVWQETIDEDFGDIVYYEIRYSSSPEFVSDHDYTVKTTSAGLTQTTYYVDT
ncbi:MAG: fibronectin type III domain-containing protein, partial [Elusimicrobiota bacterium]|nr:fibronectin type III domain-containing protein [Elusimicrobiota bacterium]